jgi:hypothetical protein
MFSIFFDSEYFKRIENVLEKLENLHEDNKPLVRIIRNDLLRKRSGDNA